MRHYRRDIVFGMALSIAIAIVTFTLILVLNVWTQARSPDPIISAVRKAFDAGDLPAHATQNLDRKRGALLYNDCLILGMALNRDPDLPLRTVSPALIESTKNTAINKDTCAVLYDLIVAGHTDDYHGLPYHRYVSAFVPVTALFVPLIGVAAFKQILLLLNYAALLSLIGAGFWSLSRHTGPRETSPFYTWVFPLILLLFSGTEFYAQNLSIGLADLGLYALIAVMFYARIDQWRITILALVAACFGVFIGAFEFFTGQIPVLLALPIALLAMRADNRATLHIAIQKGSLFVLFSAFGLAALFCVKLLAAVVIGGLDILSSSAQQLAVRVGDGSFGVTKMLVYMAGRADRLGQGSLVLGLAQALCATTAGLIGMFYLRRHNRFEFHRAITIAASMMIIVLWHIVFRNHSTIHSEFMVRSTSFVFASAWVVAGFAWRTGLSSKSNDNSRSSASMIGGPSRLR